VMDQRAWSEAHVAAFEFFGGAPERIVTDLLEVNALFRLRAAQGVLRLTVRM